MSATTIVTRFMAPASRTFSTSSKALNLKAAAPMEPMPTASATANGSWAWSNWSPKARRYATYAGIGLVADGLLVYHFYPSFFHGSSSSSSNEPNKV